MTSEHVLDARGLMCPEPIREAELALRALPSGTRLSVLATDPASPIDFEAWCFHQSHHYLGCEDRGDWLEIRIQKGNLKTG